MKADPLTVEIRISAQDLEDLERRFRDIESAIATMSRALALTTYDIFPDESAALNSVIARGELAQG